MAKAQEPAGESADQRDNPDPEQDSSARERILVAAEEQFAVAGFDATPTSRIAEQAEVPKGLVHYYFRRKQDLLAALVERLPDEEVDCQRVTVPGDLEASLHALVTELDARLESSLLLSHLLWREADTHAAVREALEARFERTVDQFRRVIDIALPERLGRDSVETAANLLARAVNYRHSVARHGTSVANGATVGGGQLDDIGEAVRAVPGSPRFLEGELEREVAFIAHALELGVATRVR